MNRYKLLLGGVAAVCLPHAAAAGPLTIAPTTITMTPERPSAVVTITNESDAPADLQFRAYAWSQPGGADTLTPTDDLVVSPSVVTVPPHGKQVFRVVRLHTAQGGVEPSYRLRLNELPRPGMAAVAINLEFSLPLFVESRAARPDLAWTSDGTSVTIANRGGRRVRLNDAALAVDGAAHPLRDVRASYVLAGATRRFVLALPIRPGEPARLVGAGDQGQIDVVAAATAP